MAQLGLGLVALCTAAVVYSTCMMSHQFDWFLVFPTVEPTAGYCDHVVWSAILFPYITVWGVRRKTQEITLTQPDQPSRALVSLGMRLSTAYYSVQPVLFRAYLSELSSLVL